MIEILLIEIADGIIALMVEIAPSFWTALTGQRTPN
jgi:hypothetical protein